MELILTDGCNERFIALCRELDAYLNDLVGGKVQREQYNQYNTLENLHDVVLVMEDGQAVACGSFKVYKPGTAEIKRVFSRPKYRNRGYARLIMNTLEERALAQGNTRLILETGRLLETAVRMYTKLGYHIIENYGQYRCMSNSICMEKILAPKPQA